MQRHQKLIKFSKKTRTPSAPLAEIARQVHEVQMETSDFSLDRLSAGLLARRLAITHTLALKKEPASGPVRELPVST
jgi:hypothetical protein